MAIKAVIDIGSNSVLLLIAEINQRDVKVLYEQYSITRISEGLFQSGNISMKALERTINVLKDMVEKAHEYKAEVRIMGTQPFRIAGNAHIVLEKIKQATGHVVEVLSPEMEALFAFLGATFGIEKAGKKLVIDLGGASTELIYGSSDDMERFISIPLGAVKISEQFGLTRSNPKNNLDVKFEKIRDLLREQLAELGVPDKAMVFITGGTGTTLAAIFKKMVNYNADMLEGTILSRDWLMSLLYTLGQMDPEQREAIPGMERGREDVIVGGIAVLLALMEILGLKKISVSTRGPRFGALVYYSEVKEN